MKNTRKTSIDHLGETSDVRVDPAHLAPAREVPPEEEPLLAMLRAIAGADVQANEHLMRRQADELAVHLRQEHRDLDRREAEINAQLAHAESQLRLARLAMRERAVPAATTTLASAPVETVADQGESRQDARLRKHIGAVWKQMSPDHPLGLPTEREPTWTHTPVSPAETESHRQLLEQIRREREELCEREREAEAVWQERRATLLRWKDALLSRRDSMRRLYDEGLRLHRESLEMRLVTQEMWSRLAATPESQRQMTVVLNQLRNKLHSHLSLMQESLEERRLELAEIEERIARERGGLRVDQSLPPE